MKKEQRINNYKQAIKDYEKNTYSIFCSGCGDRMVYGFCYYFKWKAITNCRLNEMIELNQLMPKSLSNTDCGFWWKKTNRNIRIKALKQALKIALK